MDVRRSVKEPDFDADVNVLGTVRLLQKCTGHGVRKVVFASTGGAVYGEQQQFPAPRITRSTRLPWGLQTRGRALPALLLHLQFGLPYVALRYANVYEPSRTHTEKQGSWQSSAAIWPVLRPRR